ncbi:hypothetical protein GALL_243330 [mine drainage metagenome]|uniref:Uncharacterized protein n=1 Tax=mine drainage metagenome TaxID=410659 RepID=A0A1J5S069_9ZZZZ
MMEGTVNLIVVYNPLNVRERTETKLTWGYKRPLSSYLEGLPGNVCWGVCVNADPIPEEDWDQTYLAPDDYLTIMPIPEGGGGGGGKTVMRVVAMVAVMVAAVYTGGLAASAMGFVDGAGALTLTGTAVAAGVGAVVSPPGSVAVALLPKEMTA